MKLINFFILLIPFFSPLLPVANASENNQFQWSYRGSIPGMYCTNWQENADPHTWHDNYFCSQENMGLRWSSSGPIRGMKCTQIIETMDPHTWRDNYACVPKHSAYQLIWSSSGNPGKGNCIQITEPSEPARHTWNDNYLCVKKQNAKLNFEVRWSYRGAIDNMHCTRWHESSDPHAWHDNYFCSGKDIGMKWNSSGALKGMECTQIIETMDPHTWHDNYACLPFNSPYKLLWSSRKNPGIGQCVKVTEPSEPARHTWNDNYFCVALKAQLKFARAEQIDTGWNGDARRAIDGSTAGNYRQHSVTHTRSKRDTWWEGTLTDIQTIRSVMIYNRTDCCSNRLSNFRIIISKHNLINPGQVMTQEKVNQYKVTPGVIVSPVIESFTKQVKTWRPPEGTKGRFIYVYNPNSYLSLAEVHAVGEETTQEQIDSFFAQKDFGNKADSLKEIVTTTLKAEDLLVEKKYTQAKWLVTNLFNKYPKSGFIWPFLSNTPDNVNIGNPPSYYALRMIEDIVTNSRIGQAELNNSNVGTLTMGVAIAQCAEGMQPTDLELTESKGKQVYLNIHPGIAKNDYKVIRESLRLFQQYIFGITDGKKKLEVEFHPVSTCASVGFDAPRHATITNYAGPVVALPESTRSKTDFWWVIYPSNVPANSEFEKANKELITGGMGRINNKPVFISDDMWLFRKPYHLGTGPMSAVERRTYLPQWLKHEFYHHLFQSYPEFELEKSGHQWFDRNTWPSDFIGRIEPDYFSEAYRKRLRFASVPLHIKLDRTVNQPIGVLRRFPKFIKLEPLHQCNADHKH